MMSYVEMIFSRLRGNWLILPLTQEPVPQETLFIFQKKMEIFFLGP